MAGLIIDWEVKFSFGLAEFVYEIEFIDWEVSFSFRLVGHDLLVWLNMKFIVFLLEECS